VGKVKDCTKSSGRIRKMYWSWILHWLNVSACKSCSDLNCHLPILMTASISTYFVSVAPVSDWKNQRNVRKIVLSGGNYTSCIISCLENLEMSGKLTAVGELSEMFCQGNSALLTSSLGLCQCLVSCCKHCIAILKNFFSSLSPFWTYCSDPHTGSTDKNVCFKWATQHG